MAIGKKYHMSIMGWLPCYCSEIKPSSVTSIQEICQYCFDQKMKEMNAKKESVK